MTNVGFVLAITILLAILLLPALVLFGITKILNRKNNSFVSCLKISISAALIGFIINTIISYFSSTLELGFIGAAFAFYVFYRLYSKQFSINITKSLGVYIAYVGITTVCILAVVIPIRVYITQPFVIDGNAMSPTLNSGQYILANKLGHEYQRGNIVVFKYPLNPSINYVMRIIGLPGDRVDVHGGSVYIYNTSYLNGLKLDEPYLKPGQQTNASDGMTQQEWTIGNDQYFVLGDNRDHADDSRSWGFVPRKNIIGKFWNRIY